MADIWIHKDNTTLANAVAARFLEIGKESIQERGRFSAVLAGGSTPRSVYQLLAEAGKDSLDWSKVSFFWGDERNVPPEHHNSNYKMAYDSMLRNLPIPDSNIFRMEGELEPIQAAKRYQEAIEVFFVDEPKFDLILLGLGDDCHTASLFPGTRAIFEHERWVIAHHIPKLNSWRISMTPILINQAEQVIFLVSGINKSPALKKVLEEQYEPEKYPAQIIQPESGNLSWIVDEGAASLLSNKA